MSSIHEGCCSFHVPPLPIKDWLNVELHRSCTDEVSMLSSLPIYNLGALNVDRKAPFRVCWGIVIFFTCLALANHIVYKPRESH